MEKRPTIPPPVHVRLYDVKLLADNSVRVWLTFEDTTNVALDFGSESEAAARLLDLISELATETMSRLGERGVVVTGFTPPETDEREA